MDTSYQMAAELPHSIVAGRKLDIQMLYQLKRRPSEITVSTEFLIGSSEAKAWPVIQVSERHKGRKGCSSPGVARKATQAPMS